MPLISYEQLNGFVSASFHYVAFIPEGKFS
jgi:hypothetical protein